MKIKTSIIVICGCLVIFIFVMLPIFLSTQSKKDDYVASFKGSEFSLKDMNNNAINEKSFNGPLTAIFFGFTNCPDVCPMTLNKMDIVLDKLKKDKEQIKLFFFEKIIFECVKSAWGKFGIEVWPGAGKVKDRTEIVEFTGLELEDEKSSL